MQKEPSTGPGSSLAAAIPPQEAPRNQQALSRKCSARLHPHWTSGCYRYSVVFDGKLLVERSRDPECDAARALLAQGITGTLTLLDGKTGKPRTVIDIERAAGLCVKEGPLRFAAYESRPESAYAAEAEEAEAAVTPEPNKRPGTPALKGAGPNHTLVPGWSKRVANLKNQSIRAPVPTRANN